MMASMRDGEGDDWFLLFCEAGAILKGFAHESPMGGPEETWEGVLSDVPAVFGSFLNQPAFALEDTSFCIWRTPGDDQWRKGNISYPSGADPDGSADLLSILDNNPTTYQQWAEEYYEAEVSLTAVEHIYRHDPLTAEIVAHLNADLTIHDLTNDISAIGYLS